MELEIWGVVGGANANFQHRYYSRDRLENIGDLADPLHLFAFALRRMRRQAVPRPPPETPGVEQEALAASFRAAMAKATAELQTGLVPKRMVSAGAPPGRFPF